MRAVAWTRNAPIQPCWCEKATLSSSQSINESINQVTTYAAMYRAKMQASSSPMLRVVAAAEDPV